MQNKSPANLIRFLLLGCLASVFGIPTIGWADENEVPDWLQERMTLRVSNRRDNGDMIALVRPLAESIGDSVVQVLSDGKPVALGVIVAAEGYVLTKRSELSDPSPIRVRLADGRLFDARIAAVRRKNDVALLLVDGFNGTLPVAKIRDVSPSVGSFLISAGRGGTPVGIGVVGVAMRKVEHQSRLGVMLYDNQGQVTVSGVWPDSGAEEAGVVAGDTILAINGRSEKNKTSVMSRLSTIFPGESVQLTILRGSEKLEMNAKVREFRVMEESENDSKVNGPRSTRLSGFEQVIQHDTVLNPDECGGPIIDTQGRFVGINIARAGRVVSLALPASVVISDTVSMLQEARDATKQTSAARTN